MSVKLRWPQISCSVGADVLLRQELFDCVTLTLWWTFIMMNDEDLTGSLTKLIYDTILMLHYIRTRSVDKVSAEHLKSGSRKLVSACHVFYFVFSSWYFIWICIIYYVAAYYQRYIWHKNTAEPIIWAHSLYFNSWSVILNKMTISLVWNTNMVHICVFLL